MKKIVLWLYLIYLATISSAMGLEKNQLRVGYLSLLPQLPIIVSYENDRLNFNHVDVELIKFTSFTSVEAALRVGAIHAASIPIPIILSIVSNLHDCKECDLRIVGATHIGGSTLVSKSSGDIHSLKGQMIGVPGLDSVEAFFMMDIMAEKGFQFGLDYKCIGITFDSAIKDIQSDKIKAFYLPEPWPSIAVKKAGAAFMDEPLFDVDQPTTLLVMSEKMMSHELPTTEWLQSIVRACDFIENDITKTNAMQVAIIQQKYFNFSKETVIQSLTQRKGGIQFKPKIPDIDYINKVMTKATELKLIMRSVAFDQLLNTKGFIPKK